MPNSEKTLRRLRRLGIIVAILGVFTVAQGVYFQDRTKDARVCVERKVDDISAVLNARSDAGEKEAEAKALESDARSSESEAVRRVLLAFNDAVGSGEATDAQRQEAIDSLKAYDANVVKVRAELRKVDRMLADVERERAENPVPDFPKGACEE